MRPNKHLGQHFLIDKGVAKSIVSIIDPQHGDFLIEIGPGRGEITFPMLKKCKENGLFFTYVAIEKDKNLVQSLREHGERLGINNNFLDIREGDVLKVLPEIIQRKSVKMKIFGNIPYYLTGKLFREIWELENYPEKIVFMVQKEVAERINQPKGHMNRLAAFIEFWGKPSINLQVSKRLFYPPPKVDSSIISIQKREQEEERLKKIKSSYEKFVHALFAQPRKTALNNIVSLFEGDKEKAETLITKNCGMDIRSRPQDFTRETLMRAAEVVYNNSHAAQKK